MRIRRTAWALAASLVCVPAVVVAQAAEVAPGAAMQTFPPLDGVPLDEIPLEAFAQGCSQGVPGTVTLPDGSRKDVMVTAGHCLWGLEGSGMGEMAPEVYAPLREGNRLIAVRDQGRPVHPALDETDPEELRLMYDGDDWATADIVEGVGMTRLAASESSLGFDLMPLGEPVALTGVRDYPDLDPWEISFDNAGRPICSEGQTTGRTCGVQVLRSSNGLWSVGFMLPGDSGGVSFDPLTGEALGVNSMSVYGLINRAQPLDVAIEKAYGIPDGQVSERFALPDSTEEHAPMRSYDEDQAVVQEWAQDVVAEELPTEQEAREIVQANVGVAAGEIGALAESSVAQVREDPTNLSAIADDAADTADRLAALAEDTVGAVVGAGLGAALRERQ
ncbi:hypothetical protein H7347_04110 [Corynebacterium sp. zg-331]|uniref:hypothetical protein n=1 Tax=unclassified Corynebacterium TaxID=2624378 RepID=UPI00128E2B4C|nr:MULTISPECIES: hypothetical protein [unclassified Corynebacterium]MBC3185763.1 hypothetical protein [Corynebacterium sp. zg-331]MPV52256.1 hypothetical protein [Corynebacterium sp. zg331]